MKREEFIKKVKRKRTPSSREVWFAVESPIINRCVKDFTEEGNFTTRVMEELSELIQALSKNERVNEPAYDPAAWDVLQEMADVMICLQWLKCKLMFSDDLVNKAIAVKLDRIAERFDSYDSGSV